jgi:ribosome-associated protein
MTADSPLVINAQLAIPRRELTFSTSRASGPGGQNVNKVESRVVLAFDVDASPSLDDRQKDLVRSRLATRVTRAGLLRVASQRHRTQAANRRAAEERFVELLAQALRERPRRRKTTASRAARRRRLEGKRQRSQLKDSRRKPPPE